MKSYMTIKEAAAKWNLSPRRVQILCAQARIPGLERFGSAWAIPADATQPPDGRIKSGTFIQPDSSTKSNGSQRRHGKYFGGSSWSEE